MADLAALTVLAASGWCEVPLRRLGVGRWPALATCLALLAAAMWNVPVPGPIPAQINVGGALPTACLLALAAWRRPGSRLLLAWAAGAAAMLPLPFWPGPVAAVLLPAAAGALAAMVERGWLAVLAAAAAPLLADLAHLALALADGLPGAAWLGGGASFTALVLAAVMAAAVVCTRPLPAPARGARSAGPQG